ncbi:hypothetical protein EW146_g9128 [Bondarzewia mesenterica]|uniref:Uncharacterized protein n=1 Tax=Bondarzewia mesenterica TaxID=1095465 RepID=A0A4S4L8R9_9AGAM|nr:hypothetical protein EW146_g9128 [Bondarzewia mesenterica]
MYRRASITETIVLPSIPPGPSGDNSAIIPFSEHRLQNTASRTLLKPLFPRSLHPGTSRPKPDDRPLHPLILCVPSSQHPCQLGSFTSRHRPTIILLIPTQP